MKNIRNFKISHRNVLVRVFAEDRGAVCRSSSCACAGWELSNEKCSWRIFEFSNIFREHFHALWESIYQYLTPPPRSGRSGVQSTRGGCCQVFIWKSNSNYSWFYSLFKYFPKTLIIQGFIGVTQGWEQIWPIDYSWSVLMVSLTWMDH